MSGDSEFSLQVPVGPCGWANGLEKDLSIVNFPSHFELSKWLFFIQDFIQINSTDVI